MSYRITYSGDHADLSRSFAPHIRSLNPFFLKRPIRLFQDVTNRLCQDVTNPSLLRRTNPSLLRRTNPPLSRPSYANPPVCCCSRCRCKTLIRIPASSLCCRRCPNKLEKFFFASLHHHRDCNVRNARHLVNDSLLLAFVSHSSRPVLPPRSLIRRARQRGFSVSCR